MTADRESLRFYVDESAVGLGKTLCAARNDTVHVGHHLIPECPFGTPDIEWMSVVADRGLVVLIRDKKIRTRPQEIERFREVGLRVFWPGGKRDLSTWGHLAMVVKHWPGIERIVANAGPGPWGYVMTNQTLTKVM
jgi:hypothetical protein